jgi:GPH family glycoside/pentoside/hexuronide:cation symporter
MPEESPVRKTQDNLPAQSEPLPKSFMMKYGAGQAIELLVNNAIGLVLLVYLTAVAGLDPDIAGLVLLISMLVDAFADPLIGSWSDRCNSRLGHRHPFMFLGLILLPVSVIGLFKLPLGMSPMMTFFYVLALNIVMRVANSLFILPYSALLAELSNDYEERSQMMVYRLFFAVLAWGVALWMSFGVFFGEKGAFADRSAYFSFGLLIAALILVFGAVTAFGTLSKTKDMMRPMEDKPTAARFFSEVFQLFQNSAFVSIFLGSLIFMVAAGFLNSIQLHAFTYFWQLGPKDIQMVTVSLPLGMLIGVPFTSWLIARVEKRTLMLIAVGILVTAFGFAPVIAMSGAFDIGSGVALAIVLVTSLVFGLGSGLSFMASGSMIADTTDQHDLLFNVRREGLCFASLVFASKGAIGLGGLAAGLSLEFIGFPKAPTSPEGALMLTPDVIQALGMLWGPGYAFCLLASLPFFLRFKLNRAAHNLVLIQLAKRNESITRLADS